MKRHQRHYYFQTDNLSKVKKEKFLVSEYVAPSWTESVREGEGILQGYPPPPYLVAYDYDWDGGYDDDWDDD